MALWINRSVVAAPRNGTNSHTVNFTPATLGNLLVLVLEGPVTHTVPSGWSRAAQALNNTELSVYTKTAAVAESSFTTSHNGSNYPIHAVVYEFAPGSTWLGAVSAVNLASVDPNPALTGLTGSNLTFGVVAVVDPPSGGVPAVAWTGPGSPVEDLDVNVDADDRDGYCLSISYVENNTSSTFQPTGTVTGAILGKEALTFAVKALVSDAVPPRDLTLQAEALPTRFLVDPAASKYSVEPLVGRWEVQQ